MDWFTVTEKSYAYNNNTLRVVLSLDLFVNKSAFKSNVYVEWMNRNVLKLLEIQMFAFDLWFGNPKSGLNA